jgi:ankyrin repeat protein
MDSFEHEVADAMARDNHGCTAMHMAAERGHLEIAKLLQLKRGADTVAARDNNDMTALHMAADNGHLALVEWLLELGVDIEAKNTDGKTALQLAAHKKHLAVAKLLLNHGANAKATDDNGKPELYLAPKGEYTFQAGKDIFRAAEEGEREYTFRATGGGR